MVQPLRKQPRFEDVPADASAAFTLREYDLPAFPFYWHYHPEPELAFIESGRGLRFVADSVEEFSAGDLCLLGPEIPHCWWSNGQSIDRARAIVAHLRPKVWEEVLGDFPELRKIRELLVRAQGGLVIEEPTRSAVIPFFQTVREHPPGSWERLSGLIGLLAKIANGDSLRPLASHGWRPESATEDDAKLREILDFIHASIGPDLKQRHAAIQAGMSPAAFAHFFKRSVGKTFVEYINELKVRKACQELLDPNKSVVEVAAQAGFNNLSHFNARFRRVMGVTPREFRSRAEGAPVAPPQVVRANMLGTRI